MRAQIKLGKILGVKIGLHYSWLIIAVLITLSLASNFRAHNSEWGEYVIWGTAIFTALLFFTCIIVHELAHATVAKLRGLPVRCITLFALGGVAEIEKESSDAKTEFWIGIIGPITSLVIGMLCLGLALLFGWLPHLVPKRPPATMLLWLGYINIALALFNLVPAFPLDGGRVLRAVIWWGTGDSRRATRIAARVGQVIALGLIVIGMYRVFGGAGLNGLWLIFLGWFLLGAARSSYAQMEIKEILRGIRVDDVMAHDYPAVDSHTNLQTLVDDYLLRTGRPLLEVQEQGHTVGLITPAEVHNVARNRWPYTTVDLAMLPLNHLHTVAPATSVTDALELMARDDVEQLPVMIGDNLTGLISRRDILQLLQTRAELRI